jgi:hypothetical protein
MEKKIIVEKIELELKKRERRIRDKNAIEMLLTLFPGLGALHGVFIGASDAIEIERQRLTIDQIMDLLLAIDDKLNGEQSDESDPGMRVLINKVFAEGDITGIDGNTSDEEVRKIFERPLTVEIKDSYAKGNVTGVKLSVDREMPVKGIKTIKTDFGMIEIDPSLGSVTLGKGMDDA